MLSEQQGNHTDSISSTHIQKLKSVKAQESLLEAFTRSYGFIKKDKPDSDGAINALLRTFFGSYTRSGKAIGQTEVFQVMQASVETGLNPFNNEIFGKYTDFGEFRIFATVQGWMRIASQEPFTKRDFIYSDSSIEVEILGQDGNTRRLKVPEWVECRLLHSTKGESMAREFFEEVYYSSLDHSLSWFRPARQLAHVAFIQALRRMLTVNTISDSDMIIEMLKEDEVKQVHQRLLSSQQSSPGENSSFPEIDINIEDIEIEDDDSQQAELSSDNYQQIEQPNEDNTDGDRADRQTGEDDSLSSAEELAHDDSAQSNLVELISDSEIDQSVLQIITPFIDDVENRAMSLEDFKQLKSMISGKKELLWFDQKVSSLAIM